MTLSRAEHLALLLVIVSVSLTLYYWTPGPLHYLAGVAWGLAVSEIGRRLTMGFYPGRRANPCPRCGGIVGTLFVSVSPMSFQQRCADCGTSEFTDEEEAALGPNRSGDDIEPAIVRGEAELKAGRGVRYHVDDLG